MRLFSLIITMFAASLLAHTEEPPRYSREDGYATAPPAVGLPKDKAELSRTHPGLYAEYGSLFYQAGTHYTTAPDQPVVQLPHADWAKPEQPRPLRIVALHRALDRGTDVYLLGERLGAEVKGVPLAYRELPEPPRGVISTEMAMNRLRELLAEDVDVIMVNKILMALPEEAQQLILDKVRAGTGLITVPHLPAKGPLVEALAFKNPGARDNRNYRDFSQARADGSWLTGGILFDLFPSRPIEGLLPWFEYDPRSLNIVHYQLKDGATAQVQGRWNDIPLVFTDTLGKGRVVNIAWSGNQWDGSFLPFYSNLDDVFAYKRADRYYEQMFAVLAKAVQFATSGQPHCRLLWPENLEGTAVRIANTGPEQTTLALRIVVRDPITWEVLHEQHTELTLPAGEEVAAPQLDIPNPTIHGLLGEAPALVEYTLRDDQGNSLDFGNTRLPASGQPPLASVANNTAYPNEPAVVDLTTDLSVSWTATDTWGRVVGQGKASGGKLSMDPDRLSGLLTFTIDQRNDQGQLLARTVREIWTPLLNHPRDFYNIAWPHYPVLPIARDFNYHVMRRQGGINTVLYPTDGGALLGGERMIRGGTRLAMTNVVPRWPYRELADWPKTYDRQLNAAKKVIPGNVGRLDPLTIHLMDERHSHRSVANGFEISDAALELFRAWLREEYQSIDKLNDSWMTEYADFNQVTPVVDIKAVVEQPGSYASWLDLIRWADTVIALQGDMAFVDLLKKDTKGSISFGFEGIFSYYGSHLNPYAGLNIPAAFDSGIKMNNMAYSIGSPTWELCASLNPKADSATWLGYEDGENAYRLEPWRGVLSGATFMGWFMDSLWFTPQGAVGERLDWIERYTRPLRQGVGRMMNESTRQFDDVAILANMRSSKLAWMYGVQMDPETNGRDHHWMTRPMGDSNEAFLEICRDYGLSPAYITEGQVLSGRLDQFKVLIQPSDLSIDPQIAAAIAAWVKRGGTLIADLGAGAYDQHGKMIENGPLNEVYGIKREGPFTITPEAGDFSIGLLNPSLELLRNGSDAGTWYMTEYYEPNLAATTAHAAGLYVFGEKKPMCFWNDYGEGHALYLGFLLNRFRGEEQDSLSVRPLIHAALRMAGVKPQLGITNGDAEQLYGFTITNFHDGKLHYSGVIKRSNDALSQVTVRYLQPRHVYDVMTNQYLGHGVEVPLDFENKIASKAGMPVLEGQTIASNQATIHGMALLAALPYKLAKVQVQAADTTAGDGLVVNVNVTAENGAATERHVVYLDVRDADGNAAEPYCRNIAFQGGKGSVTLPLALNEAPGTWTLTVREPITGMTDSTHITIKP